MMMQDVETMWRELRMELRRFIARHLSDPTEVEDLLQDVLLRVHQHLGDVKDPSRLTSWLFQITRHAVIDHYRAPGRRREIPAGLAADFETGEPWGAEGGEPPEAADTVRQELARCLRPMVGRLSERYREAVTLVDFEGLTQQTAAQRLGLSLSGMKSRVQRGRRRIKEMLEACCAIQLDRRRGPLGYEVRDDASNPCGDCGRTPPRHP
ncbi:RNA polymerase sigma factor SigZ [Candidatus Nitrospira bockiana]